MLRKFFVHISLFFLGLIAVKAQESLNTLIFRGNRSFDKQKYGEATSTFSEAVKKNEKDFGAHYNLGNSLYKIKKYDEAKTEIVKSKKIRELNIAKYQTSFVYSDKYKWFKEANEKTDNISFYHENKELAESIVYSVE